MVTYRVVINMFPPGATRAERIAILDATLEEDGTLLASADDADALMRDPNARADSEVRLWYGRGRYNTDQLSLLDAGGYTVVERYPPGAEPPPTSPPAAFAFTHWPTSSRTITQAYNARPSVYAQWGLTGHDGVDIAAATGAPVYAVAPGVVYAVGDERADKAHGGHNYGVRVYIQHRDGYRTIYGHLDQRLVQVGQDVQGGQLIGRADSTGNSTGPHLHLTLKKDGATARGETAQPYDIIDPTPFLMAAIGEIPPPPNRRDLLPYLRGDGRLYTIRAFINGRENNETAQTQTGGARFYQTKNRNWEEMWFDDNYIYRGIDTSPGNHPTTGAPYFYALVGNNGNIGSAWARRQMAPGELHQQRHTVVERDLASCAELARYPHSSYIKFVAHHSTWEGGQGVTLPDVVELAWIFTPDETPEERYFYARNYGLVGWRGRLGYSGICEVFAPGSRPNNERLAISCL